MKRSLPFGFGLTFFLFLALCGAGGGLSAADGSGDEIRALDISVQICRSGKMEIVQDFVLSLGKEGEIERGPILTYLTVYRGLGSLVLDHKMQVEEVLRDGKAEPFRVENYEGVTRLVCGEADVFLEPGEHRYRIRFSRNGDWIYRDGMAHLAYEVTESFKLFPIHELIFRLRLPDGVELTHFTPALAGSASVGGTGYELTESPGEVTIRTTDPLRADALLFVNASWKSNSFATQSQWLEVMKQHPKLPLTGFSAILLLASLVILLVRVAKNHRVAVVSLRQSTAGMPSQQGAGR